MNNKTNESIKIPLEAKKRIKQLIILLEKWRYERYFLFQETVPLEVYDAHFQELLFLEEKYQCSSPGSPTRKVGIIPSKDYPLVERKIPMLSLDSVDEFSKLQKWENTIKKKIEEDSTLSYLCEWKIDGLSLSLLYQNSQLIKISTRGDGYKGSDLTFNKELIKNIPFFLPKAGNYEIRGEAFMSKREFFLLNERLKKVGESVLVSPRNAAAGTIQSLLPSLDRNLLFFAYNLFGVELSSQEECLKELNSLGFSTSPYELCNNLTEVWKFISRSLDIREKMDFDCDGIVIKLNDYKLYSKVGQTSRFPCWAIAYKFPASVGYGLLRSIITEVSRSGRISYVAEIEPVWLLGSLIKKVTLHNYLFIKEKEINVGDEIIIKKSGDVIPQIVKVIKLVDGIWIPHNHCPSCYNNLIWSDNYVFQLCLNKDCSKKTTNRLAHFASRNGMNIKGISKKIIEKFYENGILRNPRDFYLLKERRNELLRLEGIKEKTVNNILLSINNSLERDFSNFLSALSIPSLSQVKSCQLSIFFSNLNNFVEALENNKWNKIEQIVGKKTSISIKDFWDDPKNKRDLLAFKEILLKKYD